MPNNHFEQLIAEPSWLATISELPLAFAQVREDPLIDQFIASKLTKDAHGIMVASGGCTAALLAAQNQFARLTLVDMNASQLALTAFKLQLLTHFHKEERQKILGHKHMPAHDRSAIIDRILAKIKARSDVFGPEDLVSAFGPDYVGRYELLFRRLQFQIGEPRKTLEMLSNSDIDVQQQFLSSHSKYFDHLKGVFTSVMSLENLVQLFGETATRNAAMPFSEHFYIRTIDAFQTLPAATNPYLNQLLSGTFGKNSIYAWLDLPQTQPSTNVEYIHDSMLTALSESHTKYDFIHLSNILDWLNEDEARQVLDTAANRLSRNGWIVIRQLNSTLNIPGLQPLLRWDESMACALHKTDRSFFYRELHLAQLR